MRKIAILFVAEIIFLSFTATSTKCGERHDRVKAVELNDEGVRALKKEEWQLSFDKFQAALKEDPDLQIARGNLGIAHNNLGLQLATKEKKFAESLKEFHQAFFLIQTIKQQLKICMVSYAN